MSSGNRPPVLRITMTTLVFAALVAGAAVLVLRPDWLKPKTGEEQEKEVEAEVPVKTAAVKRMTLRQWVEAYGTVDAAPASEGRPPGGATLTSTLPGVITAVQCSPGQTVERGAILFQLDDRLAKAAEGQAKAVVDSATASLERLRRTPRPVQLQLAQLAVDKASEGVEYAQKNVDRQKLLARTEAAATKAIEAATHDLASAQNDLKQAQGQLSLLKSSPTPEELAEAAAKVTEAEKALATAQVQRSMLQIRSPLKGTVLRVMVSPGEAVDATKPLAQLVALDRLVLNVAVPVEQAALIRVGQGAQVGADAATTPSATTATTAPATAPAVVAPDATVAMVGYDVDRKNNTVNVVVALPRETPLRPGEFLRAMILVDQRPSALAVPWKSIVRLEDQSVCVAVVHDEKAQRQAVTIGLREGDWVEVTGQTLKEGDVVVTDGAYGLPKEAKVHLQEK